MAETDARRRLQLAARYAEIDEDYRKLLFDDPTTALAQFGVKPIDLQVIRVISDDDDDPPPGCADTTCWVSLCPETCYVTECHPSGFEDRPEVLQGRPIDRVLREHRLERFDPGR